MPKTNRDKDGLRLPAELYEENRHRKEFKESQTNHPVEPVKHTPGETNKHKPESIFNVMFQDLINLKAKNAKMKGALEAFTEAMDRADAGSLIEAEEWLEEAAVTARSLLTDLEAKDDI